jgi:putative DNA primase/helicase
MLLQGEPHLAIEVDALDSDLWLINVENGTIDLRTGHLRPHSRADLLTSISPVPYYANATCPKWEGFLDQVFAGDRKLIDFVWRAIGYSLTGITSEHVPFILYGGGDNGKSVLLEVLAALFADYAKQCPTETFMLKDKGSSIPNDLARLRGVRLAVAIETEAGRRLAESLVKKATGGDRIPARFLNHEWFEFSPTFKVWLGTNHKPRISGTDRGTWRRIRLVPFGVTFKDADEAQPGEPIKDKNLVESLKTEMTGILAWAVRGCLAWQTDGLRPPPAVVYATTAYRQEQDTFNAFLNDRCEIAPNYVVRFSILYENYKNWAVANGEKPMSSTAFAIILGERGLRPGNGTGGVRIYFGIDLKPEFKPEPDGSKRWE